MMCAFERTIKAEPISRTVKKYRDDYIGQRFGSLTVVAYPTNKHGIRCGGAYCVCDCGNERFVDSIGLLIKGTVCHCPQCGREKVSQAKIAWYKEHRGFKYSGCSQERLYRVWEGMLYRGKTTHGVYADVSVCDEWQDYFNFREWALANGYDKDAPKRQCTIDRINPFGDYEPSNCRWADWDTQQHNKRRDWLKAHPDYQPIHGQGAN